MSSGISKQFKREAIFMVSFPIILILIALIAGILGPKIKRSLDVDNCLDSGGSYNYKKNQCEMAKKENH
jgi:hypothetical protein